jgi:RNA polymerase sigma factor (sigma-70 family)
MERAVDTSERLADDMAWVARHGPSASGWITNGWGSRVKFLLRGGYLSMRDAPDLRTSATLLGRLRYQPTDQVAWGEFVDRYGPEIYGWCRRWNLQDADARDVTQAVMAALCSKMKTFAYDRNLSFRGWLRTLTHHTWSDLVTRRRPTPLGGDRGGDPGWLESIEARDDLLVRLDEQFDRELLEEASFRVRLRVEPHTWEAFRLTAVERMAGAAVAEQLGMKVATVFKAKSKVQRMLREEIGRLEGADPAGY